MSLTLYKKKRNFKNTPEPKAQKAAKRSKLSFVIQKHHASHLHYDFRLEMEGVLKSWAVPKGPSMIAGEKRLAVQVEDHPLPYGKFYGEIPEGNYGAGMVEIWDNGTYSPMEESSDPEKTLLAQLKKGDLKFILNGTHLQGAFALVRMHGQEKNWLLIKKSDEHSVKKFDIEKVASLKAKVKKKSPPKKHSLKK
jgi:bifunctional non-homologous end joining protein LigD